MPLRTLGRKRCCFLKDIEQVALLHALVWSCDFTGPLNTPLALYESKNTNEHP